MPLAENDTGDPPRPVDVAVKICVPCTLPSVAVALTLPSLPVVCAVDGFTEPPPLDTPNVTLVPDTGFPKASVTIATSGLARFVPLTPVWLLPLETAIVAAAAAFTVTVAVPEVTPVLAAVMVYDLAVVAPNVVVAVPPANGGAVLPNEAEPLGLADNASVFVAAVDTLPNWSRTVIVSVAEFPAVIVVAPLTTVMLAAGPGEIVALKSTDVKPLDAARNVCVPSDPPGVAVVCASPFELVVAEAGLTEPPPETTLNVTVTPGTTLPNVSLI